MRVIRDGAPPTPRGLLLVIGSNPPTTSGERTLGRVALAQSLLKFDDVAICNLHSQPSYRTGDLRTLGAGPDGWLEARAALGSSLGQASAVLIAYGVSAPVGSARLHFSEQVAWLDRQLAQAGLPVWWVGGRPRHPSRWQRHTSRAHPGVPFAEALRLSLVPR